MSLQTGCFRAATRPVEINVHAITVGGRNTQTHVDIPATWRPLVPSEARAEFLAPDGRSRAYVRTMPADLDARRCAKAAREYATDYIQAWGGPPKTRVVSRKTDGDHIDFELRRTEPSPAGEIIWSRVMCRNGGLAIVACTVPVPRADVLAPVCLQMVESLDIQRTPGA